MIKDKAFNEFDKANYTVLGNMTENVLSDYQKKFRSDDITRFSFSFNKAW